MVKFYSLTESVIIQEFLNSIYIYIQRERERERERERKRERVRVRNFE